MVIESRVAVSFMTGLKKAIKDRRKARWEIELNPVITFCVLLFIVGVFLVWVGLFEHRVNPGEGVVTEQVNGALAELKRWIQSLR